MRLSRVQHNRSDDKDAIKLCLCHRRRLSPPPKTSSGYARDEICVRTFVSRDRNWIKHRTYKIHECTNVVVRVCYWPGVEEEECSSQDPLAVYISIFLGRLFGFACVSLSLVSTVCLSGKLYGDQSPMQCDSTHIGTAVRCVSLSCGIIVQRWCSNFFFDARRRAVFFFYYYDAASFRTTYGGQSTSGPASKSGLYPPS